MWRLDTHKRSTRISKHFPHEDTDTECGCCLGPTESWLEWQSFGWGIGTTRTVSWSDRYVSSRSDWDHRSRHGTQSCTNASDSLRQASGRVRSPLRCETDSTSPTPAQVLRQALKARLEAEIPYLHIWQEAMALGALPLNFPYTLDNLNRLAQSVCELGNTNSTASKALVGSVFCATGIHSFSCSSFRRALHASWQISRVCVHLEISRSKTWRCNQNQRILGTNIYAFESG